MVEVKTHPDHPASMEERARRQVRDSGAGAHPDTTTVIDKDIKHHVHLYGHHNLDGTGGEHPTAGTVKVHDESRVAGGDASKVGSGDRGRRGWPHGEGR